MQFKMPSVLAHAVPSIIAIFLAEAMNVEIFAHGPVAQSLTIFFSYMILQTVASFVFGGLSDIKQRKHVFIITQAFGVLGGCILLFLGLGQWEMLFLGLTFMPIPVARAALLDNYGDRYSTVQLIAITWMAQALPWALFKYITALDISLVLWSIVGLMSLNVVFTAIWFRDEADRDLSKETRKKGLRAIGRSRVLLFTLIGFGLAQVVYYLDQTQLEYVPKGTDWWTISSLSTVLGAFIAVIYRAVPDISIITISYGVGAAMSLSALFSVVAAGDLLYPSPVIVITFYSVMGGLMLPFVYDIVLSALGSRHRGIGCAVIDAVFTLGSVIGVMLNFLIHFNSIGMLATWAALFIVAAVLQRAAEKTHYGFARAR